MQEKASTQTKRSNRSKAEETATQKAKGDTKPSNTVATVACLHTKQHPSRTSESIALASLIPYHSLHVEIRCDLAAEVKASSIASNSASEKTKAADDAAKPSIEEEASKPSKFSGAVGSYIVAYVGIKTVLPGGSIQPNEELRQLRKKG